MTDQIRRPKRAAPSRPDPAQEHRVVQEEWKAQLDRLLAEYRDHYVLPLRPDGSPRA